MIYGGHHLGLELLRMPAVRLPTPLASIGNLRCSILKSLEVPDFIPNLERTFSIEQIISVST
jgi:hypothetical protein